MKSIERRKLVLSLASNGEGVEGEGLTLCLPTQISFEIPQQLALISSKNQAIEIDSVGMSPYQLDCHGV